MPNCPLCKNEFPHLDQSMEACGKCKARKPGMSAAKYAVINVCNLILIENKNSNCWNEKDKPQCGACGMISTNLKNPICNSCIGYYSMSFARHSTSRRDKKLIQPHFKIQRVVKMCHLVSSRCQEQQCSSSTLLIQRSWQVPGALSRLPFLNLHTFTSKMQLTNTLGSCLQSQVQA